MQEAVTRVQLYKNDKLVSSFNFDDKFQEFNRKGKLLDDLKSDWFNPEKDTVSNNRLTIKFENEPPTVLATEVQDNYFEEEMKESQDGTPNKGWQTDKLKRDKNFNNMMDDSDEEFNREDEYASD